MNAPVAVPTADNVARIGPDSVLQLVTLLDQEFGKPERLRLFHMCSLDELPSGEGLMDEAPAAQLHQTLRRLHPDQAGRLIRTAGERTGDHIIQRRMPVAALRVLRVLPPWLAAPLLANIIEKHAWTFAGSGTFRVRSRDPLIFELIDNPVVRGERAKEPICHWHAAVFQRLFTEIVDPRMRCRETQCSAAGDARCSFELY